MATSKNFGVNIFTEGGKAWSARAEQYQLAKGNAVTLRTRAKAEITKLESGLESLDNLKGSISEDKLPEMRKAYTDRIVAVQSALKVSLAAEATFQWSASETAWAVSMLEEKNKTARVVLVRGFFRTEYGMDVSKEWAESVIDALGLDLLGNASSRQFVRSGNVDANKATKTKVLQALMCWSVRQCRENGLKKYMFAEDIVDMYRTKKEREEIANALPSAEKVVKAATGSNVA